MLLNFKFMINLSLRKLQNISTITAVIFLLLTCSCSTEYKRISVEGVALGTFYNIHYYNTDEINYKFQIDSLLEEFNKTASIYDNASIISNINNNISMTTNEMFRDIFNKSMQISKLSEGAFDITVSPLVNAWGFGLSDTINVSQELTDSVIEFVGYKLISIENDLVIKQNPLTTINMNGIAKGYAVDLIAEFLEKKEIYSYIVEIGGEIKAGKNKPDGSKWVVAIEKPAPHFLTPQEEHKRIYINDIAMATSGSYRNYIEKDGKKYSHTIDPFTGYPVSHSLLNVTVLAKDCITADALATAFMVLGVEKSIDICESLQDIEAYFISAGKNDNWEIKATSGFKKFLKYPKNK